MTESTKKNSDWHKKNPLTVSAPEFSKPDHSPKATRVRFARYGEERLPTSSSVVEVDENNPGSNIDAGTKIIADTEPSAPPQTPTPNGTVDANHVEQLCIQEYERGVADGREAGLAEGLEQGIAEGIKQGSEQELVQRAAGEVNQLAQLFDLVQSQARQLVAELSTCLAEKIIKQRIAQDPNWIQENIQACFEKAAPAGPVRLRVHPKVRKEIMQMDPPPSWLEEFREGVQLVSDPSCEMGGCILESEHLRVDARASVQLEKLQDVLRSAMAGVLFTKE